MTESEKWYKSKTIWGAIITVVAFVLGMLGYDISAEDQSFIINNIIALVGIFGGSLAVYGRIKATKKISK